MMRTPTYKYTDEFQSPPSASESTLSINVPSGMLASKYDYLSTNLPESGAKITNVYYSELSDRNAYDLVIRTPPSNLKNTVDLVKSIGTVKSISINSEDVSAQNSALDIQIQNRELSLSRLRTLYNTTENVSNLLEIEREMSAVESDLSLLKDQKKNLISRVDLATLSVNLYEERPALSRLGLSADGLPSTFLWAVSASIGFVVFVLGFIFPVALVGGILYWLYRFVSSRNGSGRSGPAGRKPQHDRIPELD
ncbi:DUF4349 domain-containing protein [Candidatus Micrarchaeota archaeon]|nr:DUF4349 domain-containing protein [Candidatus Micrarchaeota archaeon]